MNSKFNEAWKSQENEDEELQYGPGIVNKLKSRYLSRTLREKNAGEPRRPSLRRATSLENWLDKDGPVQKEKIEVRSPDSRRPRPLSFNVSPEIKTERKASVTETVTSPIAKEVNKPDLPTKEVKKPEPLTREVKKPDPLTKEAIIIVEKPKQEVKSPVESKPTTRTRRSLPTNTRYNVEDTELPPPDTVRQVKRLFESNCARPSRRSQSAGPGLNRVPLPADSEKKRTIPNGKSVVIPANPAPQTNRKLTKQSSLALEDKPVIITKPLLSPKPALTPKPNIPFKRPSRTSLPDLNTRKTVNSVSSSPATPPVASPAQSPQIKLEEVKVVKEEETDETDNGSKTISRTALENIRKESVSVSFTFDKKEEKLPVVSKQVGVIRPQVKSEKEPVKSLKKVNEKNQNPATASVVAKETETPKADDAPKKTSQGINGKQDVKPVKIEGKQVPSVDAINTHVASSKNFEAPKEAVPQGSSKKNAKSWHNEATTTVFNFINSPKKVDHIRNEGSPTTIHLYKPNDSGITKLPDFDGGESSDFIDDMDILRRSPSPCNVHFEGANVVLQKSAIQRRSKGVKLNISFNDDMTRLFEYPSEASLLEDDPRSPTSEEYLLPQEPSLEKVTITGGLSSYTPSKVLIENTFKLGISSSVETLPQSYAKTDTMTNNVDEYLRPSEEGTTWSSETTSDLLF